MKEISPFFFDDGDWVRCTSVTDENPEKLTLNALYKVVGISVMPEGDVVYALKDIFGKLFYAMANRLELVIANEKVTEESEVWEEPKEDPINPDHYKRHKFEPIDVICDWTSDLVGVQATDTGNIIKYISRWNHKNGVTDLKKIHWYLDHLINDVEQNGLR